MIRCLRLAPECRKASCSSCPAARLRRVWDELPEHVGWFVQHPESSGFVETHREGGTMDSGVITFRREPVELRLVKDRAQWSADLIADGWRERDRLNFPLFHGFAPD